LAREGTVAKSATVQTEGERQVTRDIEFYNLDVIISVGYRVKSLRGTQFRVWATQRLREYIVKGFAMDDERLKNPPGKGHVDYFDELLERIRDIRLSVLPAKACGISSSLHSIPLTSGFPSAVPPGPQTKGPLSTCDPTRAPHRARSQVFASPVPDWR
jgi:hypothetical protein